MKIWLVMVAGGLAGAIWAGSPAGAQSTYVGVTPPRVGAVDTGVVTPTPQAQRAAVQPTTTARGLALTGGDVMGLIVLGGACASAGAAAVRLSRPRLT